MIKERGNDVENNYLVPLMKIRTAMPSCLNIISDSRGNISIVKQICITTTSDTMSLRLDGMYRLTQSGSLEESMSMGMSNKIRSVLLIQMAYYPMQLLISG